MAQASTTESEKKPGLSVVKDESIDRYAEGFDTPARREAIELAKEKVGDLKATRAKINADIKSVFEGLEALGLNRQAAASAFAAVDANVRRKEGYIDTHQLCLDVLDVEPPPAPSSDTGGGRATH